MISVIIPLYNKEKQIANVLQSVFNQTFQSYEIVIINDGSTDNSLLEVKKNKDNRIRLIHQTNSGVSAARNKGIQEAKFDLIAFLDADDEWKPQYLETQYNLYLRYPECSVFACNYAFRTTKEDVKPCKPKNIKLKENDGILNNYFEIASKSYPPLWTSAIMVKKNSILEINGFPLNIKSGEDLITWAKLAIYYKIAYTKKTLAIYHLGNSIPRPPEEKDAIGFSFENLYIQNKKTNGLKKYCAFWYKMRMCRCIAHKMYYRALIAFYKSIKYNPFQIKIYLSIFYYFTK